MPPESIPFLVGESFSPWSKKARWALEFCGIAYDYQEYTPTLSELGLRWRLRQFTGPVSVPVLFTKNRTVHGSLGIARYASEIAGNDLLEEFDEIAIWDAVSESALAEGRTAVVQRILANDLALEEALPNFIPNSLRCHLRFVARDALSRLDCKYIHLVIPGSLRTALRQLRTGLAKSENDFLLGRFSYADITMAAVIEVFAPIARTEPPLGTVTQKLWNNLSLVEENQDLVEWRDRLAVNVTTTYSQFRTSLRQ